MRKPFNPNHKNKPSHTLLIEAMNKKNRQTGLCNSFFIGGLLLLAVGSKEAKAQDAPEAQDSSVTTESTAAAISRTPSVGITLGTSGIGLQGILPLDRHFSLRGGFSVIPTFSYTRTDKVGTTSLEQKFRTGFVNIHVLADYYLPVLQKAGFRLSGGFAWFVHAQSKVRSIPVGEYYYGEIPINDERMGDINTTVKRNGIAPYLGAGFLNLYNGKRLHLSFDLGTYYLLPEANVTMESTGYLTGNERNQEQLKENLKGYRWLPVVQVGLYYKL
jgi:hypothetical protein